MKTETAIAAGEFKARCLQLMEQVKVQRRRFVITKRGKPVAKLVPVDEDGPVPVFGYLRGRARIKGNLVATTGEKWDADA